MRKGNALPLLCLPALAGLLLIGGWTSAAAESKYQRTVENYTVPDVVLVNQDGQQVRLKALVESDVPVMLDFIYGTCTTICPVLSAGFASLQKRLEREARPIRLISISIDPEHDTPKVMRDYLKQYRAKAGWDFLTGSREDIDQVMRAFDAYVPDKMYHQQVSFIRGPGAPTWVKIKGLMGSSDLLGEYQKASGK
jgi:protein SCO1/2